VLVSVTGDAASIQRLDKLVDQGRALEKREIESKLAKLR
jgi:hypothetical protein